MHTLTERDIAYDMLYGAKSSAMTYMAAMLEASHPRCRDTFRRMHDGAMRSQWSLWQFLHQKGEYRTHAAQYDEVEQVRRRMEHLQQTHRERHQGQQEFTHAGSAEGRSWNEPNGDSRSRDWSDGRWSASGNGAGSGFYGGPDNGVRFAAGNNLPQGTRFEADRSMGGGGDRAYAGSSGYAGTGGGPQNSTAVTSGPGRGDGYRNDDDRGRRGAGIGARPADGSRGNFGDNTWSAGETRYPQAGPSSSYRS